MEQSEVTGEGSALRAAVAALRAAAEAALREPGSVAFNSEVPALLLELAAVEAQVAAVSLRVIAQAQQRGLPAAEGATSLAVWLRHLLRLSPREAAVLARLAGALDLGPCPGPGGGVAGVGDADKDTGTGTGTGTGTDTDTGTDPGSAGADAGGVVLSVGAALRQGRVSLEHAGVMARTLGMVDALPGVVSARTRAEAEAFLIGQALQLGPDRVAVLGRYLVDALDQAGGADLEARERSQHAARAFTAVLDYAGMLQLRGSLPKEAGALLLAVLDPLAAPQPADDGTRDPRTATQRRADALIELAKLAAASGGVPVQGGNRACVLVTMTLDALQAGIDEHHASTAEGVPVAVGGDPDVRGVGADRVGMCDGLDIHRHVTEEAGTFEDADCDTHRVGDAGTLGGAGGGTHHAAHDGSGGGRGAATDPPVAGGGATCRGEDSETRRAANADNGSGGGWGAGTERSLPGGGATCRGEDSDTHRAANAGNGSGRGKRIHDAAAADTDLIESRAGSAASPPPGVTAVSADGPPILPEGGDDAAVSSNCGAGTGTGGVASIGDLAGPPGLGRVGRVGPVANPGGLGGAAATLLPSGQPLSAAAARRIACDAELIPVVLGSEGQVLDIGRATRQWTWAQQKAVAVRDQGCIAPGCDRPAGWCQLHHIRYWSQDGTTGIDNAAMLCDAHHDSVHHHGWTITMGSDGHPRMHPPAWMAASAAPPADPHRRWRQHLRRIAYRHHKSNDTDKPDDGTG